MNIDFQEKAEKYLLGNMSSTEAAKFEALLRDNQELQEEFQIIKSINNHFSGDTTITGIPQNEYTEKLKSALRSDDSLEIKNKILKAQHQYKKENKTISPFLRIAASLVFILIVGVGAYFILNSEKENLYASYYSPTDLPSVISRGNEESVIGQAIIEFQNKNYKASLDLLESSQAAKNTDEIAILLHYGIIHLENDNLNSAINKFDKVINSESIDKSKGYWFKALAYLKVEDYEKARLSLQLLSDNPGYFNHVKAKELLRKIEK